ncbi:MAG TPA: protein translocase subunit SecF [Acidimicrobiales bacterium]|nr:protein translocase subunit SecF [Acidimicrobiales bacterium]
MSERRRSIWGRLYHGETKIDFVGRTKLWFALSGAVILIGLVSLFTRGLNLGIDFEGGTVWEVAAGDAGLGDARDAVGDAGLDDAEVQTLSSGDSERLRVSSEESGQEARSEVSAALAEVTGEDVDSVSVNSVGPSWGDEITDKAVRALVVFLVLITVYISFRFEWKMAVATLAALLHDILVTVGVYSLFGFPVTPATVIAVLTILGYSIYDGIVVFDRVDENAKTLASSGRTTYTRMVNDSLNQVLMRTLNTSITALLPILSLLVIGSFVLGATTLQEFALALFIGLASGAYSSIFIASPLLALLKEREPRWTALRKRLESGRGPITPSGRSGQLTPSGGAPPPKARITRRPPPAEGDDLDELDEVVPTDDDDEAEVEAAAATRRSTGARSASPVQPRPRKRKDGRRR